MLNPERRFTRRGFLKKVLRGLLPELSPEERKEIEETMRKLSLEEIPPEEREKIEKVLAGLSPKEIKEIEEAIHNLPSSQKQEILKKLQEETKKRGVTRRKFLEYILALLASLVTSSLKGDTPLKPQEERRTQSTEEAPEIPEKTPTPVPTFSDEEEYYIKRYNEFAATIQEIEKEMEELKNRSQPTATSTPTSTPTPKPIETPTPTPTETPEPTKTPTPETSETKERVPTEVIYRGPAGTKRIAITIDDSANAEILRFLLNLARKKNIKMVWFLIGGTIDEEEAQIIKEALKSGLIRIGNHSFNHNISEFAELNEKYIKEEKDKWIERLRNYGIDEKELRRYFRPPGGAGGYRGGDKRLLEVLTENQYQFLCMWDIEMIYTIRTNPKYNGEYTVNNVEEIIETGVRRTEGGNLVLLHFNRVDLEALRNVIDELLNEGYEFVFPEELS